MNPVGIKIHKLGMIDESDEIILNNCMIFSGESGLGKSYISIICHYIFSVLLDTERISGYFNSKGFDLDKLHSDFKNSPMHLEISKSDFERWLSEDAITWLSYMVKAHVVNGKVSISLPSSIPDIISFKISEEMVGIGDNVETYINIQVPGLSYKIKDANGMAEESPFAYLFRNYLIQQIFGHFKDLSESYVLPPSRGMMLTETVTPLTGMYSEFQKAIQTMLMAKPNRLELPDELSSLIRDVLDGHVERREGQYIYSTNGEEMPLSAAAASVRELASLEFLVNNTDISTVSLMIDEPEAHLHPLKQRMMADILSCMVEAGSFVQITTHSDYFLRRINELVLKYELREDLKEKDEYSRYVALCEYLHDNPNLVLDPSKVSAYLLKRTEDNRSVVIKQNIDSGVPFSSFHKALDDSLRIKSKLEELFEDADD